MLHCTSSSRWSAYSSRSRSTRPTSATFDASRSTWNIDSPANSPPIATPYRPPTSWPSRQASTECAQPSSCSDGVRRRRCGRRSSRRRGPGPRSATTTSLEGGVDPDLEAPRRLAQRAGHPQPVERQHAALARATTTTCPRPCRSAGIGKKPREYASSRVPGSRSAPDADQVVEPSPSGAGEVREAPRARRRDDGHESKPKRVG